MLLGSKIILTINVLVIAFLARTALGDQTCLPRCLPTEQNTKSDCLSFRYIPTCRQSRFQPYVREPDCACLWKSFLRAIAPTQNFQKDGLGCLSWALKTCDPGSHKDGGQAKNNQGLLISELLRIAKGLKTIAPVKDEKEIPALLQELDKDARSLDKADGSNEKGASVKAGKKTGEFYGELDKEAELIRIAERLADHRGETDRKDSDNLIGPGFSKKSWWLWNERHEQFELSLFFLVLLFVAIFMLIAVFCLSFGVSKKQLKKEKREKGDLDPDVYNIIPGSTMLHFPSHGFTGPDSKRSSFEQFLDKWRNHRGKKSVFEDFHEKMSKMSYVPENNLRPRLPTPTNPNKQKLSMVGTQIPVYEQVNDPNVSEDEDTIYERARGPVYSINTTYEQPFPVPVYQNYPRTGDQRHYTGKSADSREYANTGKHVDRSSLSPVPQVIETYEELSRHNPPTEPVYYNDTLSTSRTYPEPSPVSDNSQTSPRPRSPFSIQVELPSSIQEGQRVGSPAKEEGKERTGSETEVHDPTGGQGGAINDPPNDVIDEPPNNAIDEHSYDTTEEHFDAVNEPPNNTIDEHSYDTTEEHFDAIDEPPNDAIDEHSYDITEEHFDAIDEPPNDAIDEPLNDESRSSEIPPWLRGYQTNFMPHSSSHK